jgi:hypothetical protein
VFFIQEAIDIGGIQAPLTIGIQTPTQLESMFTWGHNKAISMDELLAQMM